MAVTVFETAEQRMPFHAAAAELGADGGKVVVDDGGSGGPGQAVLLLQETDHGGDDDDRPERDDVWNMIQSQRPVVSPVAAAGKQQAAPYVHPLVRRSSSLLSQKSLEICTESLGSETGSDGFSDADGSTDRSCPGSDDDSDYGAEEVAARASPLRAFPPPLPSLARRTVGAVQMRQDRRDGRLVVKAVPVPSATMFRAQRCGGRLLLSFADTAAPSSDEDENHGQEEPEKQADELAHDEDDEEEVEVVDRGTIVEVKVSTQPQSRSNGGGSVGLRVHRSSLVINKFVNAEPTIAASDIRDTTTEPSPPRRPTGSTTTAAAALVAASALSATSAPSGGDSPGGESKLLMTTCRRRRSKEELMNHMRRCGQLSGKLFIWEPRIATSS
ncbi:protein FAF-like, chloroplastic [Oryza brachyantha]|uniref:protein FAF-like, chloroplastic n=1 Tax=Oryza brachyantha TaxID=4533 RepID=UPI001AD9EE52|nr:protein FAF-like, chloroplastic [Oryza brachyantha]